MFELCAHDGAFVDLVSTCRRRSTAIRPASPRALAHLRPLPDSDPPAEVGT